MTFIDPSLPSVVVVSQSSMSLSLSLLTAANGDLSASSRVFVSKPSDVQETLQDRLKRWRIERAQPNRAAKNQAGNNRLRVVAMDIASAMRHFHARGIVVGDLSPSRIGFDCEGRAKLIVDESSCDTPKGDHDDQADEDRLRCYMSPESLTGASQELSSDVYSFAIILWEIATLDSAYESIVGNKQKRMDRSRFEALVAERGIRPKLSKSNIPSRAFRQLLASAWDPNPDARPTFARMWLTVVELFGKGSLDNQDSSLSSSSSSWNLGLRVAPQLKALLPRRFRADESSSLRKAPSVVGSCHTCPTACLGSTHKSISSFVSGSVLGSAVNDDGDCSIYSDEEEELEEQRNGLFLRSHHRSLPASLLMKQDANLSTIIFLKAHNPGR